MSSRQAVILIIVFGLNIMFQFADIIYTWPNNFYGGFWHGLTGETKEGAHE